MFAWLTENANIPTYWSIKICFAPLEYTDNHHKNTSSKESKLIKSSFFTSWCKYYYIEGAQFHSHKYNMM